eukprot:snap_masked-scaffold_6-processed-gene-20.49-mRNA-1 protein AED:1.00 eAED:1.00 QI:0/-1/0/0/-1/1/1/0/287
MKDKRVEKQVLKIAISKLSSKFGIDTDEYNQLHKLVRSAQKKLLDKDQYENLQKMEENKKPGLELLEQLLKLKQWAMNEQEDDVKIEEVMKIQQASSQHMGPKPTPAVYTQPTTTYQSPQQHYTPQPAIQYGQTPQVYHPHISNSNMNINANQQYLPQTQTHHKFQQTTPGFHQTPQYVLAAPTYDRSFRICSKPDHYQRDCPINEMRKANGLPPIFLRAANNRSQLPSNTPPRNTRSAPVNNNLLPNFNYHLQQSSQGAMQRYQSPQRNPNRAQDVIVRRFEGING